MAEQNNKRNSNQKAFFTISIDSKIIGNLNFILYQRNVPKTCNNFLSLSATKNNKGYRNCKFHRVIPGFMIQGGDYELGNGTGGKSIYMSPSNPDGSFEDENFLYSHNARGMLSMANSGPNTNGSQFFITFRPTSHLDGKHVVFGTVDPACLESQKVLNLLENVPVVKKGPTRDTPIVPVVIVDCGFAQPEKNDQTSSKEKIEKNQQTVSNVQDNDEIDLDEEEDNDEDQNKETVKSPEEPQIASETQSIEPSKPMNPLQRRLMKLRMKMNQSKVLNRKEVMTEGERMTSAEGMSKEKKRLYMQDKKRRDQEWESCHGKALKSANSFISEQKSETVSMKNQLKAMVEPASDNIKKSTKKQNKAEMNRFDMNDYYNPEGQHRNYERSLRSIHPSSTIRSVSNPSIDDTFDISDPTKMFKGMNDTNSSGAKRLASELKRRVEKTKATQKKKQRMEFESTDINYVDKRNKHFNEKISRTYDAHTAEIRQNLERGTAL